MQAPFSPIVTIAGFDFSTVHLHQSATQIESNASAFNVQLISVLTLIESLEESFRLLVFESYARVDNLNGSVLVVMRQHHGDDSTVESVFEGRWIADCSPPYRS
jgi:hypothetical protein